MPKIDGQRVVADLKRLAEFGRYKTGVHRPTYSPTDVESRHWLADKFREAELATVIDGIGNDFGYRRLFVREGCACGAAGAPPTWSRAFHFR